MTGSTTSSLTHGISPLTFNFKTKVKVRFQGLRTLWAKNGGFPNLPVCHTTKSNKTKTDMTDGYARAARQSERGVLAEQGGVLAEQG